MQKRRFPTLPLILAAVFGGLVSTAGATTYYVDSTNGSDSNNGTSTATPWQTLAPVNATTFAPGDAIRFAAGGVWNGQLAPLGSGASGNPITIDLYGTGSQPIVNGPATNGSAGLLLNNQAYWEINHLEITNTQPSGGSNQVTGIRVKNSGTTALNHIYIQNCYVHDVNSPGATNSNYSKSTGGIVFTGDFAYVLVANCHIANVSVEALRTSGTSSENNVVFTDNLIQNVYGDGIVVHGSGSGSKVQNNTIYNVCTTDDANFAGAWTYGSTGTVVEQNEVYGLTHGGPNDGEAFDSDLATNGDVFQYNYTHDNQRGFMLLMSSATNARVRYNISQNDALGSAPVAGHRLFYQDGAVGSTSNQIYNNVFYSSNAMDTVFYQGYNITFNNNVLYFTGTTAKFNSQAFSTSSVFKNNCFYPGSITAVNGPNGTVSGNITSDPQFVSPGTGGTGMNAGTSGFATAQTGYYLYTTSPAIGTGTVMSGNGGYDYWGNAVSSTAAPNIGAYNGAGVAPTNITVGPTADAYVRDGTYANTNYGTATVLTVKCDATGYNRKSYLTFDTSSASTVNTATLRLYVSGVNTSATRTITVYAEPTTTWGETSITWNNAPAAGTQLGTFSVSNTAGLWYSFDVSSYVQTQRANGVKQVSFVLINNGPADSKGDVSFASKEASTGQPQLVIQP